MREPTEIDFLSIGNDNLFQLSERLKGIASVPTSLPFTNVAIDFVTSVSKAILTDGWFRNSPEVLAVANWFRLSRILALKTQFLSNAPSDVVFTSRGLVFHIPPSNVDTIFIYSWFISLLCGNSNVIRLSERTATPIVKCFEIISSVSKRPEFGLIRKSNFFVRYKHEVEITSMISQVALCRVIWGGDNTVKQIRAIPLNPLATEICFPDRFSFSVIETSAFFNLATSDKKKLVKAFLNDAFWFSQLACSSPKAVFWIGAPNKEAAQSEFWSLLQEQLNDSGFFDGPPERVRRLEALFNLATEHLGISLYSRMHSFPLVVISEAFPHSLRHHHSGRGLFFQMALNDLSELAPLLSSKDQTISYFGISKERWVKFISESCPHACDRIVPIGKSLEFSNIWDGGDLLTQFCRAVTILRE